MTTVVRRRRNKIVGLKDDNGNWVTDKEGLKNITINYFQKLFSDDMTCTGTSTLPNFFLVTDQSFLDNLLVLVSNSEIKTSMFTIGPYKASGPDGFAACLYQQCWEICGAE
ncbi:PREDICTED: reverse mRNAase, partial [Prunus dulcis]